MPTTTREDIQEWMIQAYGLGRRGTNDVDQVVGTTVADDSQFGGAGGDSRIENGCDIWLKQDKDSDGVTVNYYTVRVSQRPSVSNGKLTMDPVPALAEVAAPLNNTTTFSILYRPLRFEDIYESIDWAVTTKLLEKLLLPITLFPDGDMLASSATDDWGTAVSATPTKVAATFPLGLRMLRVAATNTAGYQVTRDISTGTDTGDAPTEPGETYYLEVTGMLPALAEDRGTLILWNVQGAEAITLDNSVIDRYEPEILVNPSVTMPTGCTEVEVRLQSDVNGDVVSWANLIFRKNSAKEFIVQDRHATVDRLGKLFVRTNNTWGASGNTMTEVAHTLERRTAGIWVYKTDVSLGGKSVWYEEWRRPAALTADTSTVALDKEDVAAVAAENLLLPFADRKEWSATYKRAASDAARVLAKYQMQERTYDTNPTELVLAET